MKTDLFQSHGHGSVFHSWWYIDCSTLAALSFSILGSSSRILSPLLALFAVMLLNPTSLHTLGCLVLGEVLAWNIPLISPIFLKRSLVFPIVGWGCLLWPVCSLGKKKKKKNLLPFALPHFVCQDQTCLLLQVSLDFLLCIPIPYDEKYIFFFFVLVIEVLISLHKQVNFSFFGINVWGINLDYCETVMLNDLPWKQTYIILSLLRLHLSTLFWTPLLTMRATSFLLRDCYTQD